MKIVWGAAFTTSFLILILPTLGLAHDGELDRYGCHEDRERGGYHCHDGMLKGGSFDSKGEMIQRLKHQLEVLGRPWPYEDVIMDRRWPYGDIMEEDITSPKPKLKDEP